MSSYINKFFGEWQDEEGNRLIIRIINDRTAAISFFSGNDKKPILRPWFEDKPSTDMVGKYYPEEGPELVVELWKPGKKFSLHLSFSIDIEFSKEIYDSIVPAINRYEDDDFLDQYYSLFGPLKQFAKNDAEQAR